MESLWVTESPGQVLGDSYVNIEVVPMDSRRFRSLFPVLSERRSGIPDERHPSGA
jgi:hypothetical protein